MNRIVKIVGNTVYGIGTAITGILLGITLFGSDQLRNPEAMIPVTWKHQAFMWLAFGAIPMLLACLAAVLVNEVKNSSHKRRNILLLFLPGIICSACAIFIIGVVFVGMMNSFLFR